MGGEELVGLRKEGYICLPVNMVLTLCKFILPFSHLARCCHQLSL